MNALNVMEDEEPNSADLKHFCQAVSPNDEPCDNTATPPCCERQTILRALYILYPQSANSGLIIPPPQDQHRPKNKLKNQHQQRIAQCVGVPMHVRVDGLLGCSGNPQRSPSMEADGSVAGCSPHTCSRN